jgi:hypothetical protein
MKNIFNFFDFINEELKKTPTEYKFTSKETEDKKHDRLASKKKDGHAWKASVKKKHGKESITQNYSCECGYKKVVVNDENNKVTITYSK